jgi:hypothetical protein
MSMTPLVLPLKANEAAALADLVYRHLEGHALTADLRNHFAAHLPELELETFVPLPGSLARDPIHHSTYYIAIDTHSGPMLLEIAPASSPAGESFAGAIAIGRMRPGGGRELVLNAVPFDSTNHENVRTFAERVDPAFLPRAQGLQSAILVESGFEQAFRAFRAILKSTGLNLAAIAGDYDRALWSAIRAGWREGWTVQTSDPAALEYTKYSAKGTLEELEEIYKRIRVGKAGREFDFEINTPGEIAVALEWMKSRGMPVQFVRANPEADLAMLATIARGHDAILSFTSGSPEQIGIATAGRFHYRMHGDEEAIRLAASGLLGKTI